MESLVAKGLIPKVSPLPKNKWKPIKTFKRLSKERRLKVRDTAQVVIDNAVQVGITIPLLEDGTIHRDATIYSMDAVGNVASYTKLTTFTHFKLDNLNGEESLIPVQNTTLFDTKPSIKHTISEEEENIMAKDPEQLAKEAELAALLNSGEGLGNLGLTETSGNNIPTNLEGSDEFQGSNAAKNRKSKEELEKERMFLPTVQRTLEKEQLPQGLTKVHMANHKGSELIGYLVDHDARNEGSLKKKYITVENKRQFIDGTPDDIRAKYEAGEEIDKSHFDYHFELALHQSAPGPIKYVVIQQTQAGLLDVTQLQGDVVPEIDTSLMATKKQMVIRKEEFPVYLSLYFGEFGIKESPKTHKEYASTVIVSTSRKRKVENNNPYDNLNPTFKEIKGRALIVPGNYFPIKVDKQVLFSPNLSEEEMTKINNGFFHSVVSSKIPGEDSALRLTKIRPEDADKVSGTTGDVKSVFFTRDTKKFIEPQITPYYNRKGEPQKELWISIKERQPLKNGELSSPRYVTYSVMDEENYSNPEIAKFLPENKPQFQDFIQATGELTRPENLRPLFARVQEKKTTASNVATHDVTRLILAMARGSEITNVSELQIGNKPIAAYKAHIDAVNDRVHNVILDAAAASAE